MKAPLNREDGMITMYSKTERLVIGKPNTLAEEDLIGYSMVSPKQYNIGTMNHIRRIATTTNLSNALIFLSQKLFNFEKSLKPIR